MDFSSQPNILIIFSDQQHWQTLGRSDPTFNTPHQDAIAAESVIFEHAFCTTPQCSPSRSSLLTGMYPSKTGVWGNTKAAGGDPLHMPTFGLTLQNNGYNTGYFGKWHLGNDPNARLGWSAISLHENDNRTTQEAINFFKKWNNQSTHLKQGSPFALVLSYRNPHDICSFPRHPDISSREFNEQVPLPPDWIKDNQTEQPPCHYQFLAQDSGKALHQQPERQWIRYRALYRGVNHIYDKEVGKVLNALNKIGEYENTIIIMTSDHGDMDTHHGLLLKGPFMFDHLLRIPLMIRVPSRFGGIGHKTIQDVLTTNVDIVPTILDFCNIKLPALDGLSLKPILTQNDTQNLSSVRSRDYIIAQYYSKQQWVNPIRTIRTLRYKYNKYLPLWEELYDLERDPEELINVASDPQYAGIKTQLQSQLEEWMKRNKDPFYTQKRTDRQGNPLD